MLKNKKLIFFLVLINNLNILVNDINPVTNLKTLDHGEIAPTFFLRDIYGRRVFLNDYCGVELRNPYQNKEKFVVILSFFTTYCISCREEIKILRKIFHEYKSDTVKIFLINVGEKSDVILSFIKKFKIKIPILLDKYSIVAKRYKVESVPCLIVIDKEGFIKMSLKGLKNEKEVDFLLRRSLQRLLN